MAFLVNLAVAQLNARPVNLGVDMLCSLRLKIMAKKRTWKPLTTEHIGELIGLVVHAYELANRTPSMRRLAVHLIKVAAWRWTADAVDVATDIVIPDAVKYDIRYLPHTANAALVSVQYPNELAKRLTHEHTIPLALLAEKVLSLESGDKEVVSGIFKNYCRAAIVTREEDRMLNSAKLRSAMPPKWCFGGRYTCTLLYCRNRVASASISLRRKCLRWFSFCFYAAAQQLIEPERGLNGFHHPLLR